VRQMFSARWIARWLRTRGSLGLLVFGEGGNFCGLFGGWFGVRGGRRRGLCVSARCQCLLGKV